MSFQAALQVLAHSVMCDLGGGDFEIRLPKTAFDNLCDEVAALTRYQAGGYVYPKKMIEMYSYSGVITIKEI